MHDHDPQDSHDPHNQAIRERVIYGDTEWRKVPKISYESPLVDTRCSQVDYQTHDPSATDNLGQDYQT